MILIVAINGIVISLMSSLLSKMIVEYVNKLHNACQILLGTTNYYCRNVFCATYLNCYTLLNINYLSITVLMGI